MPLPTSIEDLSTTAASNSPTGSESPITADNYFRTHASFIAELRDGAKTLADYTALRAYIGSATSIRITGVLASAQPQGIAGQFQKDTTDTTSGCRFTGSMVGTTTLTASAVTNGSLALYQSICHPDTGVFIGYITAFLTGAGGIGTYTLSAAATFTSKTLHADNGGTYILDGNGVRWKRQYSSNPNSGWFNLAGDNSTDDYGPLLAAVSAVDILEFEYKTYYCSGDISISKDFQIVGNGATIRFASGKKLSFSGSIDAGVNPSNITALDQTITLATACVKGDVLWIEGDDSTAPAANLTLSTISAGTAVTVTADASVFVAGDVGKCIIVGANVASVYLTGYTSGTEVTGYVSNNNAPSSTSVSSGGWTLRTNFCPSRPYYERGELCRVISYAAGVATLEVPVIESYTGTDCNVYKMSAIKVVASDLTVSGSMNSDGLLKATYIADSAFKSVKVANDGTSGNGIYLIKSFNCDIIDADTDAQEYATLIHGCQNIRVRGGDHLSDDSHAVEVSSGTDTPPSRFVSVDGVTATSRAQLYALNTHGGTSQVTFKNSTAFGGVAMYGQNQETDGCTITMGNTARVALRLYPEMNGSYMNGVNNTVLGGIGIYYRENFAAVGSADVNIDNNTGVSGQGFTLDVDSRYNAVPFATRRVSVTANDLHATAGNCVSFDAGAKTSAAVTDKIQSFRVVSNKNLRSTSSDSVNVRGNSRLVTLSILTSRLECAATKDGFDITDVRDAILVGNEIVGAGAGGSSNKVAPAVESVICTDNHIYNFTADLGLNISNTSDARNNIVGNNHFHTVAGTLPSYEKYPFLRFNNNQNVWATATTIPTTGSYTKGDIVWKSDAALDANNMILLGWYRLTTGSNHVPGTDWSLMYVSHVSPAT